MIIITLQGIVWPENLNSFIQLIIYLFQICLILMKVLHFYSTYRCLLWDWIIILNNILSINWFMWFTKLFWIICSAQRQILLDWLINEKQLKLKKKNNNCFHTLILLYWIFLAVVSMWPALFTLQKSVSFCFL